MTLPEVPCDTCERRGYYPYKTRRHNYTLLCTCGNGKDLHVKIARYLDVDPEDIIVDRDVSVFTDKELKAIGQLEEVVEEPSGRPDQATTNYYHGQQKLKEEAEYRLGALKGRLPNAQKAANSGNANSINALRELEQQIFDKEKERQAYEKNELWGRRRANREAGFADKGHRIAAGEGIKAQIVIRDGKKTIVYRYQK